MMRNNLPLFTIMLLAVMMLAGACGTTEPVTVTPEYRFTKADAPTFYRKAIASEGMVVSAHPLGSEAGKSMLALGGNAVDAAVATAFAIAVLEPNMSGLGGSGAMTIWNRQAGMADYLDFYAATGADPDYNLDTDPDSLRTPERGVAVPGMVAGLLEALERYGTLDRQTVMEPAIRIAEEGFIVHHLLADVITGYSRRLLYDDDSAALFYPDGGPLRAGDLLVQPELAGVLRSIAEKGRDGFYSGDVARRTIEKLSAGNSRLTLSDFENYEPAWRGALCQDWMGHRILSAPPSLAGHEVILGLKLVERGNIARYGHPVSSGEALGVLVDAIRIARADRGQWQGDPGFVDLPVAGMISDEYASLRAAVMGGDVPDTLHYGNPWPATPRYTAPPGCIGNGFFVPPLNITERDADELRSHIPEPPAPDAPETEATLLPVTDPESNPDTEEQHTTHISVVDRHGNAVSMTNTLGLYFGSAVFSDGVFYNSANHNFGGSYGSIRGPGHTAHSSTAPTIVLSGDRVELVVGSPGSGRIPPAVISMIVHTLIYDLHPADAIRMPRVYPMINDPVVQMERGFSAEALRVLNERGYVISPSNFPMNMLFGGVQMIRVLDDGTMIGVSDPRRDGGAAGL
jgi:gamma-glutamyltranspeptidase / glutathione hydrolase